MSFTVYEIDDLVSAGDSDNNIRVAGYGMEREDVLGALEHVDTEAGVDDEGLPDGFERIARGPFAAADVTLNQAEGSEGLTLGYAGPSIYEASSPDVLLAQQPADSDAAGLLRLVALEPLPYGGDPEVDVEMTEIRGNEAHVLRYDEPNLAYGDDPTTVAYQWFEPSVGQVVTILGYGISREDIDSFIAGLRIASDAELDELLARDYPWLQPETECDREGGGVAASGSAEASAEGGGSSGGDGDATPPPGGLPLPEGADRLASGQEGDLSWQLSVVEEEDGCGSVSLDTAEGRVISSSSLSISDPLDSAQTDILGYLDDDRDELAIFGFVAEGVAEVRLEHSDGESYPLELHDLDSFEAIAFVGVVPPEMLAYEFVALDEDGNVVDEWPSV